MAGKKKDNATVPQKWEDVPEIPKEEQPYPLPEGWKWVKLNNTAKIIMGQSPCGDDTTDDPKFTPLIGGASDMGLLYPEIKKYTKKPTKLSQLDDVIVCVRATLGKPIFSDGVYCLGRGVAAIRPHMIDKKFLRYFLVNSEQYLYDNATGSTFAQINSEKLADMPIPLPPFETQHRIVNHIESLFSKVDEAAEKVQSVIDSHEARKQAILHKAFSGELTRKWREENGIGLDSWEERTIKDIGEITTGSTPSTKNKEYYGGEIPFIKPTDLNNGRYVQQSGEYLSEAGKNVSRTVRSGSTCVCCIGATISKCGFLICDAVTNQQINTISPHNFMNDLYVYYYCLSDKFKNSLIENSSATTLPIINKSKMGDLKIIVPLLMEQNEIVRIIEFIFYDLDNLYNLSKTLIDKIIAIKLVLLNKIFQGKLL